MVTIFIIVYIILSAAGLFGILLDSDESIFNKIIVSIICGWILFPIAIMIVIGFAITNYFNKHI